MYKISFVGVIGTAREDTLTPLIIESEVETIHGEFNYTSRIALVNPATALILHDRDQTKS